MASRANKPISSSKHAARIIRWLLNDLRTRDFGGSISIVDGIEQMLDAARVQKDVPSRIAIYKAAQVVAEGLGDSSMDGRAFAVGSIFMLLANDCIERKAA